MQHKSVDYGLHYRMKLKWILILLVFCSVEASAQVVMGSQVDFKQLDTFQYQVRFQVYTDCRKGTFQLDSNSYVQVAGDTILPLNPTLIQVEDVSNYHDTISHCGSSDSLLGVLQYTYIDTVDFNTTYLTLKSDSNIRFEFYTHRMMIGNTIMCGTSDTLRTSYNFAELHLQKDVPGTYFRVAPQFFTGQYEPHRGNFLAAVNNGLDSVSYAFGNIFNDSTGVQWNCSVFGASGFSYAYYIPMSYYLPGSLGWPFCNPSADPPLGICLNPITSELTNTPINNNEQAIFAIEAKIWQKDSLGVARLVGKVRREQHRFTHTVADNNPPKVNGPFVYDVCANGTLCFNVVSSDMVFVPRPPASSPPPDTVTLEWDSAMAQLGATFTILDTTARLQTGRFCFTPSEDMVSTIPYMFSVTARDNRGYYGGLASRVFSVRVKPQVKALSEIAIISCGSLKSLVHSVLPDSTTGSTFTYHKEILDSSGQNLSDSSAIWFGGTRSVFSVSRRDSVLGDTSGIFIIKNTVSNPPINCPFIYYDTLSLNLQTYSFEPLADTVVICNGIGDTIQLKDNWESVVWSTGDSSTSLFIDSAGQYFVVLRDSCGNSFIRDFEILIENTPSVDFRDTIMCPGDSILYVYQDSLLHNILWSTGDTLDSFAIIQKGGYFVDISNHCGAIRDTFIVYDNYPQAHIEEVYSACDTVILKPIVDYGLNVETYWLVNLDTISDLWLSVNSPSYVVLNAKTKCHDVSRDVRYVKPLTAPDIKISSDFKFSCIPQVTSFIAAGRYVDSAVWSTGDTGSSSLLSTYGEIYVQSVNTCGTAYDTAVYVKNKKPIVSILTDSSVCGKLTHHAELAEGFGVSHYWLQDLVYRYQDSIISTKLDYISLTASNACGQGFASVYLAPPSEPVVEIGVDSLLVCDKPNVILKATGNFQNNWVWNDTDSAIDYIAKESKTYHVTNARYCATATDSVVVRVDSIPILTLRSDTTICNGDSVLLNRGNRQLGVNYLWHNGSTSDSFLANKAGVYTLDVSNVCGSGSDSFTLKVEQVPELKFDKELKVGKPFGFTLNASQADKYIWNTGDTGTYINISDTGVYWVKLSNRCGYVIDSTHITYFDNVGVTQWNSNPISIYPNPASSYITLESGDELITKISIDNSAGIQVLELASESNGVVLDVATLAAGIYKVKVFIGDKLYVSSLVLY